MRRPLTASSVLCLSSKTRPSRQPTVIIQETRLAFHKDEQGPTQCDQIGRFLKALDDKWYHKSKNVQKLLGYFEKSFSSQNSMDTFWAALGKFLATFNFNNRSQWSHLRRLPLIIYRLILRKWALYFLYLWRFPIRHVDIERWRNQERVQSELNVRWDITIEIVAFK